MNIQKLFKPYFVRQKNGQCQVLIPLVELDELCESILRVCGDPVSERQGKTGNLATPSPSAGPASANPYYTEKPRKEKPNAL